MKKTFCFIVALAAVAACSKPKDNPNLPDDIMLNPVSSLTVSSAPVSKTATDGSLQVRVTNNENLGMNTLVHGTIGDNAHIVAKLRGWAEYRNGETAGMRFGRKHFFDKDTTDAIRKGQD